MDEVQPDHTALAAFVEVAEHGFSRHLLQLVPVLPLREDAVAECAGFVSAFVGLGHLEDDLGESHRIVPFLTHPHHSTLTGSPRISARSPSVSFSSARMSALISFNVRIGFGL